MESRHLERARMLGRRGWGRVHPNPMVGCVIVAGDGVVAEGWHRRFGGPHAEVEALEQAGPAARGSTVYVSMEPCRHEGKTPPCTEALIEAGVARVVYGAADPGAESGGGGDRLRDAGLDVMGPVYTAAEARAENPAFFHDDPDRPWTVLKLAVSLDGAVSRHPGRPTALSGPEAQARVHRLRAGVDAILVGAGTVRADRPRLTVRGEFQPGVPPIRVVLDPGEDGFDGARDAAPGSLSDPEGPPVWVAVRQDRLEDRRDALEARGMRVLAVPAGADGGLDPGALVRRLRAEGVERLLCEGGARWARTLLGAGLVDRIILITAPVALGEGAVSAMPFPEGRWRLAEDPLRLGQDIWCEWDSASDPVPDSEDD